MLTVHLQTYDEWYFPVFYYFSTNDEHIDTTFQPIFQREPKRQTVRNENPDNNDQKVEEHCNNLFSQILNPAAFYTEMKLRFLNIRLKSGGLS